MAELAAHLSDSVVPAVPVRQWVLSVPERLQPYLMQASELAGAVLHILLWAVRRELRGSVRGSLPGEARLGAVSFLHRFGSAVNPHPHFHLAIPMASSHGVRKTATVPCDSDPPLTWTPRACEL